MAYVFQANEPMVSYAGITIYHVYRNNFNDSGWREYLYTANEYGCEDDDDVFDIRDMPGYDPSLGMEKNLLAMIQNGQFGDSPSDVERYIEPEDSKAGVCPACGSHELDYDTFDVMDDTIAYPFTCKTCGVEGKEYASLVFNGFDLD